MLGWIVATALLGGGEGEAVEELKQLCKQFQKVENYTFSTQTESSGGGFGQGGGEPQAPIVGEYIQDQPIHLSQGELEAFMDDGQIVYKSEEDGWTTFDMESMRGVGRGGRRRGGEGADAGQEGAGEGGRRELGGGNRNARRLFRLARTNLPHELLDGFEGKVSDVVRTESDGKLTYSGKLTKDGVRAISFFGRRGRGGSGSDFDYSGSFELTLGDQGQLQQLVFNTSMEGSFGDRDFKRSSKRTIKLSKLGGTEFEIPADALSKFEL